MENTARLLLYNNDEFFAQKAGGKIGFLEAEFSEEEIPEEALAKKAKENWGVEIESPKLLCILPKTQDEFVQYFACRNWSGEFENLKVEEIDSLGFEEASELSEKSDILAVQVLEKAVLGKEFRKAQSIITGTPRPETPFKTIKDKAFEESSVSTEDFEIMPAVPKGMGRKQLEPTREGIDYEILSKGNAKKQQAVKQKKTIML